MKKLLIDLIYKAIELIEKVEYRNYVLDEDNNNLKILSEYDINYKVKSDKGYVDMSKILITQPYTHYYIELENGMNLTCADNHRIFDQYLGEVFVKHLKTGDKIYTNSGVSKVKVIKKLRRKTSMIDITVDHEDHRYYTNGILSHNTVCASIYILHYMMFNNNKNVLIAANKLETSQEVLDKIKTLYSYIPMFLKQGIDTWNVNRIKFENGCRAKAFAMTKNASIGNAGDLVYVDEFAHINSSIADKFYKSIFPTLASIENSKMIITSTPDGYNLFHKLLTDAEREMSDPLKNEFTPLRVYWHQVPGRNVTYFKINPHLLAQENLDIDMVFNQLKEKYNPNDEVNSNNLPLVAKKTQSINRKTWIHIQNTEKLKFDDLKNAHVLNRDGEKVFCSRFCDGISTWKLDAIKNIGGEDNFNQEYDLRFASGSRSVLKEETIERITNSKQKFKHISGLNEFDKLKWDYGSLKFIEGWDESIRKNLYGMITVDVSEGLGQDYSVINMFRLGYKPFELIEEQKENYAVREDFFQLKQFGLFRSNIISVEQLAELLYILVFEFFDPDKIKVVVEYNNDGKTLLNAIKNVFNKENDYSTYVMLKFKHRLDAIDRKVGLKVGPNKNKFVKDYQLLLEDQTILVSEENTIKEISTFISHETAAGNIVYRGDGSNDDLAMTIVNMTQGWSNRAFKDLILDYMEAEPNQIINKMISEVLEHEKSIGTDYGSFFKGKQNSSSYNTRNALGGINPKSLL